MFPFSALENGFFLKTHWYPHCTNVYKIIVVRIKKEVIKRIWQINKPKGNHNECVCCLWQNSECNTQHYEIGEICNTKCNFNRALANGFTNFDNVLFSLLQKVKLSGILAAKELGGRSHSICKNNKACNRFHSISADIQLYKKYVARFFFCLFFFTKHICFCSTLYFIYRTWLLRFWMHNCRSKLFQVLSGKFTQAVFVIKGYWIVNNTYMNIHLFPPAMQSWHIIFNK